MATSKLQRYVSQQLSIHLGQYIIRENVRPDWLITLEGARLELDFYIEELRIAIEVQGKQHYIFVPFLHGTYSGFQKRLRYDQFKRYTCQKAGINLIEISSRLEVSNIVHLLKPLEKQEKIEYIAIPKYPKQNGIKISPKLIGYYQKRIDKRNQKIEKYSGIDTRLTRKKLRRIEEKNNNDKIRIRIAREGLQMEKQYMDVERLLKEYKAIFE